MNRLLKLWRDERGFIGTGAAILASGLAAAGASAAGSKIASKGTSKAADIQSKAAADALEYTKSKDAQDRADFLETQRANYDQWLAQQERLKPYQTAGAGASQMLRRGLGLPDVELPKAPPPPNYATPNVPPVVAPTTVVGRQPVGRASTLLTPTAPSVAQPTAVGRASDLMATGVTKVQMPDGSIVNVPIQQVRRAQALGGRVLI